MSDIRKESPLRSHNIVFVCACNALEYFCDQSMSWSLTIVYDRWSCLRCIVTRAQLPQTIIHNTLRPPGKQDFLSYSMHSRERCFWSHNNRKLIYSYTHTTIKHCSVCCSAYNIAQCTVPVVQKCISPMWIDVKIVVRKSREASSPFCDRFQYIAPRSNLFTSYSLVSECTHTRSHYVTFAS